MTHRSTARSREAWILDRLAAKLGVDARQLDPRRRFQQYGVDSALATALAAELGTSLGRALPATLLWDHPTAESLARHLAGEREEPRAPAHAAPADEPIAVIGLACRAPGAASAEALFRLLCDGVDAITPVPASRWDAAALYDPDPRAPGKASTRWGGYLDQVDRFDAAFFGISPREAAQMDPQQRLMLELAWEALDDAGVPPAGLRGSRTAVVFGVMWSEYGALAGGLEAIAQHTATGRDSSIVAARVSYLLGLNGPSLAVNTACSSSLVAVHLACQSLRSGEATMALAGGVNLMLAPDGMVAMSKFGAMAPDGRSKAFDARADGYVRGEGGGVVALKPLSRALADGDPIRCVLRGSAANNDGFSNGLTAPSPEAQEAVLREAYARAGVDPRRVDFVEAHGTGTLLGDPIEAKAIGAILGAGRDADRPLYLGSLKTNIGHLEAAAGVVGLIKAAFAVERRVIPPNLHFRTPNPQIPFEALRLSVPRALTPWPREGEPAVAGVSSFGFGGTNCHVVLESGPAQLPPPAPRVASRGAPRILFVFSGNGSAWAGMGRDLLGAEPVVRAAVARCDRAARSLVSHSLLDDLARGHLRRPTEREDPSQLALFAVQIALADLWRSWGIEPDAVVGHSVGEVAAAYVAGAIELEEAVRIVHHRGRLQRRVAGKGAMAVVELPRAEVEAELAGRGGRAGVAAENGPVETVISGEPGALTALVAELAASGVRCRAVHLDIAGHSPQMDPLRAELASALGDLRPRPATIPIFSTVTATPLDGRRFDAAYWAANLREPVRFAEAAAALRADGEPVFVELSPSPLLKRALEQANARVIASLERGEDGPATLRRALGELRALGAGARRADPAPHLIPLSAHTPAALRDLCASLHALVTAQRDVDLRDLAYTAGPRRSHHDHRLAVVASTPAGLAERLAAFLDGHARAGVSPARGGRTAFVFSGHGAHWIGMGRELLRTAPAFRRALLACDDALAAHLGWSVAEAVAATDPPHALEAVDEVQPIVFAVQVALAAVWRSWGIEPDVVVGHSLGEVAGAHTAGALDLADAARIVCARSRALARVAGRGGMVAAEISPDEAARAIAGREDRVAVAAINGPTSVALSGEPDALAEVVRALEQRGVRCRRLSTDVAFHSPALDPLRADLAAALAGIAPRTADVAIVSTVTGAEVDGASLGPGYWARNLREPVRFWDAARSLFQQGVDTILEVSPHPVLAPALDEVRRAAGSEALISCSLRRGEGEREAMLGALGALYARGHAVHFDALHPQGGRCLRLPPYPWQRERHWIEARPAAPPRTLLGAHLQSSVHEGVHFWEAELNVAAPGEAYAEMARRAASEVWGEGRHALEDITFPERGAGDGREIVQLVWSPIAADRASFRVSGRTPSGAWQVRASGQARRGAAGAMVYEIRWEAGRAPAPRGRDRTGRWLLLGDGRGVAPRVAAILEAMGEECTLIHADPRLASDPAAARAIVRDGIQRDGLRLRGVVCLSALDAPEPPGACASRDAEATCAGLLHIAQALVAGGWDEPPRLWLVTAGALPVGAPHERVSLGQAAVWGLGRVIAAEHAELRFAAVDLPAADPASEVEALVRTLLSEHTAEQIGLRGGVEHTPRLIASAERRSAGASSLWPDATYLITGGLGALGLAVAGWMAEAGARHLVLVGRSPPDRAGERALASIRARGAEVIVHRADVASFSQIAAVFAAIDATLPPLRGVIHAAGVLHDALVPDLRADQLGPVLAPKVDGAVHLHRLTEDRALDFFVLFSSIASWIGLAGQASYAAANAFLDALAQHRRAHHLPALSVGWGSFTGVGLAGTPGGRRVAAFLARRGVSGFSIDEGLAALGGLLSLGAGAPARALVMPLDPACAGHGPASRWDALLGRARPAAADGRAGFRDVLAATPPARRPSLLAAHVTGEVAGVLGLAPDHVDAHAPMSALGMDSLMALELRDRLEASLGIPMATTLVWQRPTVAEMASYLAERLSPDRAAPPPPPAEPPRLDAPADLDALLAEVEQLSDDTVREELAEGYGARLG
ncbi:uncharacterized protein SOCE26_025260 [Sorangium cellulosum]|uniref:Polyketide synthase n=1 Tax=Sorangium cellulosum TaxID=56 RepID=A0A2L0EP92_SORCE|nr:type I polyketide synthase [Sorangium cellulosum]AUX41121.1 uncharacterized protein SOCE26_025260 [Sorangium cellulosum]